MAITISGDSPNLTSPNITGAVLSSMASSVITSRTAVASTSGTSIDFTGIPSWVKRITVMFSGVSTNGTSNLLVQLGTPSFTTSGYSAISSNVAIAGGVGGAASTSGFIVATQLSASSVRHGHMVLTNITGNVWVSSHVIGDPGINFSGQGGGNIGLGAVLTAVRITTVNGTDTFDAGSINILYE